MEMPKQDTASIANTHILLNKLLIPLKW